MDTIHGNSTTGATGTTTDTTTSTTAVRESALETTAEVAWSRDADGFEFPTVLLDTMAWEAVQAVDASTAWVSGQLCDGDGTVSQDLGIVAIEGAAGALGDLEAELDIDLSQVQAHAQDLWARGDVLVLDEPVPTLVVPVCTLDDTALAEAVERYCK